MSPSEEVEFSDKNSDESPLSLPNTRSNMKAMAPSHLHRRARMKMLLLHLPKNRSQMQNGQHSTKEKETIMKNWRNS